MNTSFNRTKPLRLLAAAMAAVLIHASSLAATPKEGEPFPNLEDFGLQGALPSTAGKVVLIDFFASWCDPCRDSFPVMEDLHRQYGPQGLVIIAINLDQDEKEMREFLKKHPASFTIVRDASKKLVSKVKIPTMPSSFLLDRNGRVQAMHRGFKGEQTRQKYVREIEMLLK